MYELSSAGQVQPVDDVTARAVAAVQSALDAGESMHLADRMPPDRDGTGRVTVRLDPRIRCFTVPVVDEATAGTDS
jgi:hypothetical protein